MKVYLLGIMFVSIVVTTSTALAICPCVNEQRIAELEVKVKNLMDDIEDLNENIRAINDLLFCKNTYIPKMSHGTWACDSGFKKGDTVYDIVKGKGIVVNVAGGLSRDFTVEVKFPNRSGTCLYTKDGKWSTGDLFPSLYNKKMKIVEDIRTDIYRQFVGDKFYKGQTVWDVLCGEGVVVGISENNVFNTFPVAVELKDESFEKYCNTIRNYTLDGRKDSSDLLPSLYSEEMKIVKK